MKKITQADRMLRVLEDARGGWVNGRFFLHEMFFSQYHRIINDLEKEGHEIQHSHFTDEFGFKSYRIVPKETHAQNSA